MPNVNDKLSFRPTDADTAHINEIVSAIRSATGAPFVSRTEVFRVALKSAVTGRTVADIAKAG